MFLFNHLKKQNKLYPMLLGAIFLFYLFTRVFLFVHEGAAAFGYDTGIYRHVISGYFERLHDTSLVPFGFSAYSNFLKVFGESTDMILLAWYLVLSVFLFFIFYLFVKTYTDTETALIAVFLFTISMVQYEFFWWFYYRNYLAFCLFFVALILLRSRSYLAILPLVALGTVHVLTLLPLGLTMMLLCVLHKDTRKYYFVTGLSSLTAVLLLNWRELWGYLPDIQQSHGQVAQLDSAKSEFSGQFVDFTFFWKHTILYLFFGILGCFKYYKKQSIVTTLFVVSTLPVLFGILFYRRFYIFLDVCLIFFAAVFLKQLLSTHKNRLFQSAFVIFCGIGIFLSSQYVVAKEPLINHFELENISNLNRIPEARVIALSSAIAPWLYGFTHHAIIAPGIFEENKWNQPMWNEFWSTSDVKRRHELLNQYADPLYIYVSPFEFGFEGILRSDSAFREVQPSLWKYTR